MCVSSTDKDFLSFPYRKRGVSWRERETDRERGGCCFTPSAERERDRCGCALCWVSEPHRVLLFFVCSRTLPGLCHAGWTEPIRERKKRRGSWRPPPRWRRRRRRRAAVHRPAPLQDRQLAGSNISGISHSRAAAFSPWTWYVVLLFFFFSFFCPSALCECGGHDDDYNSSEQQYDDDDDGHFCPTLDGRRAIRRIVRPGPVASKTKKRADGLIIFGE